MLAGELELHLEPQGTLAESCAPVAPASPASTRALVPAPTPRARKPLFDGQGVRAGRSIHADVSIVKAWKGDRLGNLVFAKTARNFNPMIATCGKACVAEVEELVEVGTLDPEQHPRPGHLCRPHHPGPVVREAHRNPHARWCQQRQGGPTRIAMAQRAAKELRDGFYVNLGTASPRSANYIPEGWTWCCNRRTACSASARFRPRTRST